MATAHIRPHLDRLAAQFFGFLQLRPQAIAHYRAALAAAPQWTEGWRQLGYLLQTEGRGGDAIAALQRAISLDADDAVSHFNLGFILQARGSLETALHHLEQAARLDPTLDRAWYGIGTIRTMRGEFDRALPAFEEAVRLQPFNGIASEALCRTYARCRRPDALQREYRRIASYDPPTGRRLRQEFGLPP